MHRPTALVPCLLLALCLAGFSGETKQPAPGNPVPSSALVSIYRHWFDSPYEYMFDGNARLTVGQRTYGEFMAGISGIMNYGGLGEAVALHLGKPKPSFGDIRAMEQLSGLKIYIRQASTRDFGRFNPKIVRWGYANLIPDPATTVMGHRCQDLYDKLFARFFRMMAESYVYLQRGGLFPTEQRAYLTAMKRKRFDGIAYLQQRFAARLQGYSVPQNGSQFTPQMAIGFWIRRHTDGTAAELWKGLGLLLARYDSGWWSGLQAPTLQASPPPPSRKNPPKKLKSPPQGPDGA